MWFQVRDTHLSWLKGKILFITMILGSFTEPKLVLRDKLEPSWRSAETLEIYVFTRPLMSTSLYVSASFFSQSANQFLLFFPLLGRKLGPMW